MAKQTISTSTEREKRDLVKSISERGRAGYKAKEETVKPNVDLAAAGAAAVAAEPVDLTSAAQNTANAVAGAPAASAGRYAEAQRALFEQGRGREQVYMGERYGAGQDTLVEGTNVALGKYDDALAEQEAARLAAQRSYGAGDGDEQPEDYVFPENITPNDLARFSLARDHIGPEHVELAKSEMFRHISNGLTWEDAVDIVFPQMVNIGWDANTVTNLLRGLNALAVDEGWYDKVPGYAAPGNSLPWGFGPAAMNLNPPEQPRFGPIRRPERGPNRTSPWA